MLGLTLLPALALFGSGRLMGSDDGMMTYRRTFEEVSEPNVTSPQIVLQQAPMA